MVHKVSYKLGNSSKIWVKLAFLSLEGLGKLAILTALSLSHFRTTN